MSDISEVLLPLQESLQKKDAAIESYRQCLSLIDNINQLWADAFQQKSTYSGPNAWTLFTKLWKSSKMSNSERTEILVTDAARIMTELKSLMGVKSFISTCIQDGYLGYVPENQPIEDSSFRTKISIKKDDINNQDRIFLTEEANSIIEGFFEKCSVEILSGSPKISGLRSRIISEDANESAL
jgi:hypothetical protein